MHSFVQYHSKPRHSLALRVGKKKGIALSIHIAELVAYESALVTTGCALCRWSMIQ